MIVARRGARFFLRAEPSGSEGGLSEEMKNREGVASGSATLNLFFFIADKNFQPDWLLEEFFKVA